MKHCRIGMVLVIAVAALLPCSACAQGAVSAYPTKPVRVIVGLAPGGATDIQARWYSQKLTESLGGQFVVDNRSGAGGLIAYQLVANASPDGYTLLAATPGFTIVPSIQKAPYDPLKDFAPVSLVTKAPYLVVVTSSFPPKSMKEFIAFARAKPDELLFGYSGNGTTIHLGTVWLAHATNTKMTIIPYKGTGPVLSALLAAEVHATLANVLSALPIVKTGRLRALAVTTPERSSALPDLPSVAESGVPGYDVNTWHAWLAPKGTPAAVIRRLNEELAKAVKSPEIAQKLAEDGAVAISSSPEQFGQHIAEEVTRWKKLVKETGATTN